LRGNRIKNILREFGDKTRAMYWYLLWKYGGQTTIVNTQAGICLFAVMGENGVYDVIQRPAPQFIQDFRALHCEGCDECVEDDEEDEEWEDDEEDWEDEVDF